MNFFGYLDPGTGTVIVQALLGGAAGVAVLFKTMGHRLTGIRRFGRSAREAEDGPETDIESTEDSAVQPPSSE